MRALNVLVEEARDLLRQVAEEEKAADLRPEAWGVLYTAPNPDGSRKRCDNCALWVKGKDACVVHARGLRVGATYICGYHVFGTPLAKWLRLESLSPLAPEFSGLENRPSGTSCDNCSAFSGNKTKGNCAVVRTTKGEDLPVAAKGCCARWTPAP